MKNYLILLIAILWSYAGFSQTHFTDAHAGTNAEAYMSIYVFSGQIGGTNLQAGDEIAVFDGSICVGVKVLASDLTSTVSVKAAKKDAGASNGYTSGHSISMKIWKTSSSKEYDATVSFKATSPYAVFTDNESAYVDISAKEALSINLTATDKVYDGTNVAAVSYAVSGGSLVGDVTVTVTNGAFSDKNVGAGKTVTATITPTGADVGNYDLTINSTTTAAITALPITLSADALSKVYGEGDPSFTVQVTTGVVVAGDLPSGALSRVSGDDVNTYAINQGTFTYGSNYSETFVSANLTILVKSLVILPDVKTKSYGDVDPTFTFVPTPSLVAGDAFSGSLSRTAGETIGNYNFNLGSLSGGANYALTLDAGSPVFAITTKELALTGVSVTSKTYDGNTTATLAGTAALSGVVGGETVRVSGTPTGTFSSANAGNGVVVVVSGLSLLGADAGNYILNSNLTGTIVPKELTVSGAAAQDKVYDGTTAASISGASLVGVIGTDDVSLIASTTGVFVQKDVGANISVTTNAMVLSGSSAANYSLTAPTGLNASITAKVLDITANDQQKCFGSTLSFSGNEVALSGLVFGDIVSGVTLSSDGLVANALAAVYDIVPSAATGSGLGNYTISYFNGKLTVDDLPIPTISGSTPATQQPIQVIYTTEVGMSNYVWSVTSGGVISSGNGSSQITVDWTNISNQSITVSYQNGNGCTGTFSQSITSFALPTATLSGSADICAGSSADMTVLLTGESPWRITYTNGSTSETISDITSSPYVFSVTPVSNSSTTYSITSVVDGNNMINTGSGTAVVTVLPDFEAPLVGSIGNLCYGSSDGVITATATANQGANISYRWESSVDNINWVDLNATGLSYSLGAMYNSMYYRVSASLEGCGSKYSNVQEVKVNDPLTPTVVTSERTVLCFGDAPFMLTATPSYGGNGTFSYQWQKKTSGSWSNIGTNALSFQPEVITVNTTYRVITSDLGSPSCGSVFSNELTIVVSEPILPGTIAGEQSIMEGSVPSPITSVIPGSGSGTLSYAWGASIDEGANWTLIEGATGAGFAPLALSVTTLYRRVTISTVNMQSCYAVSEPVKIKIWATGADKVENARGALSSYAVSNTAIRVKGAVSAAAVATLYNISGKVVLIKSLDEGVLNVISTPNLPNGIYILDVKDKENTKRFKLSVKE